MARNNAKNIALQLGALWRCNSQQRCCVAAAHVAVVLQAATLRRCGVVTHNNAATRNVVVLRVAAVLQLALLRRYSSHCCDATAAPDATSCHATTLWRYSSSRCCGVVALQQLAVLRRCNATT